MEKIYIKVKEQEHLFTKNLQNIATYVYNDPKIFAIYSATEAGKHIGVSETTIIRFCKQLGYFGYREFQAEIQKYLFQQSSLGDFVEKKTIGLSDKEPLKHLMVKDLEAIQKTMELTSENNLKIAVDKLTSADNVLVSGVRASHALASWFAFSLDIIRGNSRLFQSHIDDILLRISELTTQSVLVVFSFHRYAKDTINIAKLAHEEGAFVIAFTDSPNAPVTKHADLVLRVELPITSTLDVAPSVMSLAKAIISAISLENKEKFQERVRRFDAINGKDFFS